MMEGLGVEFLLQPSLSSNTNQKDEICAQVCTLLLMRFNHIPVDLEDIYLSGIPYNFPTFNLGEMTDQHSPNQLLPPLFLFPGNQWNKANREHIF